MPFDTGSQRHPIEPAWFAQVHPTNCAVCDAILPRSFPRDPQAHDPRCQDVACRMVLSRRVEMGEAGFRSYLQKRCAAIASPATGRSSSVRRTSWRTSSTVIPACSSILRA